MAGVNHEPRSPGLTKAHGAHDRGQSPADSTLRPIYQPRLRHRFCNNMLETADNIASDVEISRKTATALPRLLRLNMKPRARTVFLKMK